MILQCPSCTARFLVADALIPEAGRTVKCGKCTHQWFVTRAMEEPVPIAAAEAPAHTETVMPDFAALTAQAYQEAPAQPFEPKQLPTIPAKPFSAVPFMIAAPLLAACWLIIAIFAYFPDWQTGPLKGIYSSMGATDTSGLVFADVAMERQKAGERTRFLLTGSIANHGTQPRTVPSVRVELKDNNGKVVWKQTYEVGEAVEPGQVYPFRIDNVETTFADRASSIVLDIGNSFELMMR